jgi:glycosyltransferase involved in cell wall biosynthesis
VVPVWRGETLAVVLPTYNEADSIADCVKGFEHLGIVDDIVVVNNNAHPDTSPNVAGTSAREVFESQQGYGAAIRRGLQETSADLVCICEPDGTFDPNDLLKLLPFLTDSDAVFGSRTVSTFIFSGANMGPFLRWGNWAVAKLIEVLFYTAYLSDVGCTFRVLRQSAVQRISPSFVRQGSSFGLEMLLQVVRYRIPFVQVPVRYLPRVGESSVTGDFVKALSLGLEMIGLVLRTRLRPRPRGRRPAV